MSIKNSFFKFQGLPNLKGQKSTHMNINANTGIYFSIENFYVNLRKLLTVRQFSYMVFKEKRFNLLEAEDLAVTGIQGVLYD